MRLSLFNTLANFLRYISKILAEKLYIFFIFYLNDIFIYNKNLAEE